VKPLGVIWGKFPDYSADNTIMLDDIRRNFLMNPQNGLKIKAFRQAHLNRCTDRELLKLAKYLRAIAPLESLALLNHRYWEKFLSARRKDKRSRQKQSRDEPSTTHDPPPL
jgi:ubiquitin-like domain-containing CTD phosphatase 1